MKSIKELEEMIEKDLWGDNTDDTRVIATLLLSINHNLAIQNKIALAEAFSSSDREKAELLLSEAYSEIV